MREGGIPIANHLTSMSRRATFQIPTSAIAPYIWELGEESPNIPIATRSRLSGDLFVTLVFLPSPSRNIAWLVALADIPHTWHHSS
jgi:hypothetical protein